MPRAPINETTEEKRNRYIQSGYKVARTRKQNLDEDGNLKVSEDELWEQASRYADRMIDRDRDAKAQRSKEVEKVLEEDEQIRANSEKKYRDEYDWNTSNDEAGLQHLLDLEMQIRQINRELNDDSILSKDKLRKSLTDSVKEHRQLQVQLGIDRPARDKKLQGDDPIDDWERIKEEALLKKEMQRTEFLEKAAKAKTEAELRDTIKVGLLLRFPEVDAMLSNHRRVLDLPTEVQKS